MSRTQPTLPLSDLRAVFGERLQENVQLANYATARVGGPADALLPVHSADELAEAVQHLWEMEVPYIILGGGSNILISDAGFRGLVLLNRARNTRINVRTDPPTAWAESGANFSALARQTALRGMAGLEWAVAVPGTVGGAVYGNAGAYGADVRTNLLLAEILHPTNGRERWPVERMDYDYRSSSLKHQSGPRIVVLSATFQLAPSVKEEVQARIEANSQHRRGSQPAGATMGSMFKNPPGEYAGRLIEAAGLKGTRVGGAEISSVHANFFINEEGASAQDIYQLIDQARKTVKDKFGVDLELEIELIGDWEERD